jgi:hypothetical protein
MQMELNEKLNEIEKKLDYLTTIIEEHVMSKKDFPENPLASVMSVLESSPLANHPMFKEMTEKFKQNMAGEKI